MAVFWMGFVYGFGAGSLLVALCWFGFLIWTRYQWAKWTAKNIGRP